MTGIDWFLSVASNTSERTDPARGCFWIAAEGPRGKGVILSSVFARRCARADSLTFTEDKAVVDWCDGRQLVANVDDECRAFARREPVGAPGERVSFSANSEPTKDGREGLLTRS